MTNLLVFIPLFIALFVCWANAGSKACRHIAYHNSDKLSVGYQGLPSKVIDEIEVYGRRQFDYMPITLGCIQLCLP